MKPLSKKSHFVLILLVLQSVLSAEPAAITVHIDQPGVKISSLLYGIFFEEINRAGDGGLYAEMIQNRSFEDDTTPIAWTLVQSPGSEGGIALDQQSSLNKNNPTSLRLEIKKTDGGRVGVANDGFKGAPQRPPEQREKWKLQFDQAVKESHSGISVETGKAYDFSFYARSAKGFAGPLTISIEKQDGTVLATHSIEKVAEQWNKTEGTLTAKASDSNARLVISSTQTGIVWLDMVSLFPKESFKGRANGVRVDLARMIANMHPGFIRFPGGCFVEGDTLENATRWKKTIGDIAERPGHYNLWGYRSTDGLGFHEYLQFCEDIGAEPLFVINCGIAHHGVATGDKMDEFVQDALDAIEYANGPVESQWGAMRAKAGHPLPFNLRYMEIGNENGGGAYYERFALMHDAIKKLHPEMQLIACVWHGMPTNRPLDLIDEHYYRSPEWFESNATLYDSYDRKGPKIYIGEYAVTAKLWAGKLAAALGEAAFMTGMERNGDIVAMGSYAPLLELDGWKTWTPNAIVFDNSRSFGIPSYYVQALFAANRADVVLPLELKAPENEAPKFSGPVGIGTRGGGSAEFKDIKVTQETKTLFEANFSDGQSLPKCAGGECKVQGGALVVIGKKTSDANVFFGDKSWSNYTFSLKARKVSGQEGLMVLFANNDGRLIWNVGGWANTAHGLEMPKINVTRVPAKIQIPGSIKLGQWYDVRVELKGASVKCYLDGALVQEAIRPPVPSMFAVAGLKESAGEIILKVVNTSNEPRTTTIAMQGSKEILPEAEGIVMAADDPMASNSFENPENVVPKARRISGVASRFEHAFPANSITVIRAKVK